MNGSNSEMWTAGSFVLNSKIISNRTNSSEDVLKTIQEVVLAATVIGNYNEEVI